MERDPRAYRVRIHHALRCAFGGTALAALGLTTTLTSACFASVLFFISTVAGTPQNYQGFQLRSVSLTFTGVIIGLLSYALVSVIADRSRPATFFSAIPFIFFFSALRADPTLMPMPPVANVVLGLNLISRRRDMQPDACGVRQCLPKDMLDIFIEAVIAWALANLVNLLFADRATDVGRRLVASELRRLGSLISQVAANAFSPPPNVSTAPAASQQFETRAASRPRVSTEASQSSLDSGSTFANVPTSLAIFLPQPDTSVRPSAARFPLNVDLHIDETNEMVRAAYASLTFLHDLPPIGSTRVEDYSNLEFARVLLAASAFEPRLLPEAASRWRNARVWIEVVDAVAAVVNKVSCLESVVELCDSRDGVLNYENFARFVGEAYVPLWISHLASCAASCASLSALMCRATCVSLTEAGDGGMDAVNPQQWRGRRAEMYFGFLFHCRLTARAGDVGAECIRRDEVQNLETNGVRPLDLQYSLRLKRRDGNVGAAVVADGLGGRRSKVDKAAWRADEHRAMSFFAIECHALAEEIGHVRSSMVNLASSSDARGYLAPFQFLVGAYPGLRDRMKDIVLLRMQAWEVQFAFTHGLLLSCVLGCALFLPLGDIEQSEVAWAFTSAALAAQLSAEPTLFISVWRVLATITGAATGFGFSSLLRLVRGPAAATVHLWLIPYMFIVILACLLVIPVSHRYAAFLIIVTNAIVLFCPRSNADCSRISIRDEQCFPDWKYALSRMVNVSIGVVFALIFHILFWPRYANEVALRKLCTAFENASRVLRKLRLTYFSFGLKKSDDGVDPSGQKAPTVVESSLIASVRSNLVSDVKKKREDIYQTDCSLLLRVQEKVGKHVFSAVQMLKTEAGLMRAGPLRLRPLLRDLEPDFIALTVTLSEMAALLGRQPIFSVSYGRVVFDDLIEPMLEKYETIQISLNNMVGVVRSTIELGRWQASGLRENSVDLCQAIAHVARCRSELRQGVRARAEAIRQTSMLDEDVRRRLSQWSRSGTDIDQSMGEDVSIRVRRGTSLHGGRRQRAIDDAESMISQRRRGVRRLHIDDVILYDAMTFIAEGCLSAFVRIALTVLQDAERRLAASEDRDGKKER